MLLRRVMQHVKDQNWLAVGLDFVIVVVGILLAFQITQWTAERQERRAEGRYLVELARDLKADIAELTVGRRNSLARLRLGETILLALDREFEGPAFFTPPDAEASGFEGAEEFQGYTYASLTSTFIMIGTDYTFDELVQSGNLGALSNRGLVNQLAAYYGWVKRKRVEFEIAREQVGPLLGYLRDNGLGMADRATIEDAIELARADPRFLGFVKMAYFLAHWQHAHVGPMLAEAEAALGAVQAEIESRQ
jgi:hypothetical protein